MILVSPLLFQLFFRKQHNAFAFWPFIVLRSSELKSDEQMIRHERIHFRQQLELLLVFFYLIYVLEFVIFYIKQGNWDKAYRSISFEKEAYANDRKVNYLRQRKPYAMWRKGY
jgi:hypothetical protein